MPKPKPNEDKDEWMKRCVPALVEEGKEPNQSVAICSSMWETKNVKNSNYRNKA